MGEAKRKAAKRQRFLAEHPVCYFCATRPANTIEHMPSRVIFPKGFTPEGYEFPACEPCNKDRSNLEQVMALYVNMFDFEEANLDNERLVHLLKGVGNNNPDLVPTIDLSAREKRNFAKEFGLTIPDGQSYADLPIASLPTGSKEAINHFGRKLTCALFYKVVGRPIPLTSPIATFFIPFANNMPEDKLDAVFNMMQFLTVGGRTNVEIGERFEWMWNKAPDASLFAYVAKFSKSLLIFGAAADRMPDRSHHQWMLHAADHPDLAP